ncbi:MAG: two-component system, NarL family, sensor histidine kinase DegS [Candidatus Petromonas sp.]|jgi:two-component system sensor histidine kinase DegS|nr:two-component system, NarL family, sensor histidine kinase DegS [Candidatus Petromonas sp.]
MAKSVDIKVLNEIVDKTIHAIESGKKEIFEISEKARDDCREIEDELIKLKKKTLKIIEESDRLEKLEKESRKRLLEVSKNFTKFTEEDIKQAYETAKDLQVSLSLKRQEEKDLIKQRTILEMRLKKSKEVVERSEALASKVGVALGYLSGNLQGVFEQLEDIQQRQSMGIKIIKAQEQERQRVSKEIHDGPAQTMANIVLKAELCDRLIDLDIEKAKNELNTLKGVVRESLKDIRKIIYDLMPMSLDDLGLIPTIQRLILNFEEETKISVDFVVNNKGEIKESIIQLTIFRIVQEALNNIKKHSKAQNVVIRINIGTEKIYLKIIDDGIGFNVGEKVDSFNTKSGFGLYSIRERVDLLKGKIEIDSELGKGTKINVIVPLYEGED